MPEERVRMCRNCRLCLPTHCVMRGISQGIMDPGDCCKDHEFNGEQLEAVDYCPSCDLIIPLGFAIIGDHDVTGNCPHCMAPLESIPADNVQRTRCDVCERTVAVDKIKVVDIKKDDNGDWKRLCVKCGGEDPDAETEPEPEPIPFHELNIGAAMREFKDSLDKLHASLATEGLL